MRCRVTGVHVPVEALWGDLRRRPLVIARPAGEGGESAVLATSAKNAVGRGADLVEFPATQVDAALMSLLNGLGIGVVAAAHTNAEFSQAVSGGVAVIRWGGPGPVPGGARHHGVVFSSVAHGLGEGDALVVRPNSGEIEPTEGVRVVMDLEGVDSRAELAALTTLGLGRGVHGFVTSSPAVVRRAAHVIRAVELAE